MVVMELTTLDNVSASIIRNSARQAPSNLVSYSNNTTTIHRLVKETLTRDFITIRRVACKNMKIVNI